MEPTDEETLENEIIKTEPMDDLPEASELDDIPTDFHIKSEPEFNQFDEDFPVDLQEGVADETSLESAIEVKIEHSTDMWVPNISIKEIRFLMKVF